MRKLFKVAIPLLLIWNICFSAPTPPVNGGTGVSNNNSSTITINGSYPLQLVLLAPTSSHLNSDHTVYVDCANGSDGTGATGGALSKYATLSHAESVITTATQANPYQIVLNSATCTESSLVLKPDIYIDGADTTLNVTGSITLDPSFGSGDHSLRLNNIQINPFDDTTWDFTGYSTHSAFIEFNNIRVMQNWNFSIIGTSSEIIVINGLFATNPQVDLTLQDIYGGVGSSSPYNLSIINTGNYSGSVMTLTADEVLGNTLIQAQGSQQQIVNLTGNSLTLLGGTVTLDGANVIAAFDPSSFSSIPTLLNGAGYVLKSIADGINSNYTATNYFNPDPNNSVAGSLQGIDDAFGNITLQSAYLKGNLIDIDDLFATPYLGILNNSGSEFNFNGSSSSTVYEVFSTTQAARPWPVMSLSQFSSISGPSQGSSAFLNDTTHLAIWTASSVQQISYLSDLTFQNVYNNGGPSGIINLTNSFPFNIYNQAGNLNLMVGSDKSSFKGTMFSNVISSSVSILESMDGIYTVSDDAATYNINLTVSPVIDTDSVFTFISGNNNPLIITVPSGVLINGIDGSVTSSYTIPNNSTIAVLKYIAANSYSLNFYYSDTLARNALQGGEGIDYNPTTGIISATGGGGNVTLEDAYNTGDNANIPLQNNRPFLVQNVQTSTQFNAVATAATTTTTINNTVERGFVFTVPQPTYCYGLQYDAARMFTSVNRQTGLFVNSTQQLLGFVEINPSSPLDITGNFRQELFTDGPILLVPGVSYVYATIVPINEQYYNTANTVVSSGVTVTNTVAGPAQTATFPLVFPTGTQTPVANNYVSIGSVLLAPISFLESVNFNDSGTSTDTVFGVQSSMRGSVPLPPMTNSQRNSITVSSSALGVFSTDDGRPEFYSSGVWNEVAYLTDIPAANTGGMVTPVLFNSMGATGITINPCIYQINASIVTMNCNIDFTPTSSVGFFSITAPFMVGNFVASNEAQGVANLYKNTGSTGADGNNSYFQSGPSTQNFSIPWVISLLTGSSYKMTISMMYILH